MKIIKSIDSHKFVVMVNQALDKGWRFHGFVNVTSSGEAVLYSQAFFVLSKAESNVVPIIPS